MARGDHIYVERINGVYAHHGIDCGDGSVIHYTSKSWRHRPRVQHTTATQFAKRGKVQIKDYDGFLNTLRSTGSLQQKTSYQIYLLLSRFRGIELEKHDWSPEAVIARAEARIGEQAFNIVFHNCEHFATWCKTGISSSDQANAVWQATMSAPEFIRYRADKLLLNVFEPKWPGRR
jgi:hypothetical protein